MGTYEIPRNVKGENRLFKIFSIKALLYTLGFGVVGIIINAITTGLGIKYVGLVILGILALFGFVIGTFKMPNLSMSPIFRITAGENIDDILLRAIRFRRERKIYIYGRDTKK